VIVHEACQSPELVSLCLAMFGVWPDRKSVAHNWAVTANRQDGPSTPRRTTTAVRTASGSRVQK